ncbi:hypothetical protein [Pseudomonas hormoni]
MTMPILEQLLGILASAGLFVFVVTFPGILGKRTEVLFKNPEPVEVIGISIFALCCSSIWLLNSTPLGALVMKAYFN